MNKILTLLLIIAVFVTACASPVGDSSQIEETKPKDLELLGWSSLINSVQLPRNGTSRSCIKDKQKHSIMTKIRKLPERCSTS